MTPKEKAEELIDKIKNGLWKDRGVIIYFDDAMYCALIAVDEIINSNPCYSDSDRGGNFQWYDNTYYWQEVKQEIENL